MVVLCLYQLLYVHVVILLIGWCIIISGINIHRIIVIIRIILLVFNQIIVGCTTANTALVSAIKVANIVKYVIVVFHVSIIIVYG